MTTSRVTTILLAAATVGLMAACGAGHSVDATAAPTTTSTSPHPAADTTPTVTTPTVTAPTDSTPTDSTPTVTAPTDSTPTSSSSDDPTTGVPFPHGHALQTGKRSGAWDLVLTGVRVVKHESFDRIVLDFTGSGTPGWAVDYVRQAVLDGSGRHVRLRGGAFLNVSASGTTWPDPDYYQGPRRLKPEEAAAVEEVYVGGTFEGYTQVLVGVGGSPAPFRTFVLSKPSRLVIDVADDGTS
jgi:hypothetical protein